MLIQLFLQRESGASVDSSDALLRLDADLCQPYRHPRCDSPSQPQPQQEVRVPAESSYLTPHPHMGLSSGQQYRNNQNALINAWSAEGLTHTPLPAAT